MRKAALLAILVFTVACSEAPAPDDGAVRSADGGPAASLDLELRELLPVALFFEGTPFCSATLLSPDAAVTIEHCGRAAEGRDVAVHVGVEAAATPAVADVRSIVFSPGDGAVEGIALLRLEPTPALREAFSAAPPISVGEPPLPARFPGDGAWWTAGYGFGCDQAGDATCCDARFEDGCLYEPFGRRHRESVLPVGTDGVGIWSAPLPGAFLCEGDSGVGMATDLPSGAVRLGAVYSGSYYPSAVDLSGTRFERFERLCVAFEWEPGPAGIEQAYANEWARLCHHEALLRAEVPGLAIECPVPACSFSEADSAQPEAISTRAQDILDWVRERSRCE